MGVVGDASMGGWVGMELSWYLLTLFLLECVTCLGNNSASTGSTNPDICHAVLNSCASTGTKLQLCLG